MKRGEILDAVKQTITKDRNNRHGEPENSFPLIAKAWADYIFRTFGMRVPLQDSDAAEMLAEFKGVRFGVQPDNPDNEHDRIGYFAIAAELRAAERERQSVRFDPPPPFVAPGSVIFDPITAIPPEQKMHFSNEAPPGPFHDEMQKYRDGRNPSGRLATCMVIRMYRNFWNVASNHKPLAINEPFPAGLPGDIIETEARADRYWICTEDGGHWTPYRPDAQAPAQ